MFLGSCKKSPSTDIQSFYPRHTPLSISSFIFELLHSVHWSINSTSFPHPSKTVPSLSFQLSFKIYKLSRLPFQVILAILPSILAFSDPSPKNRIFQLTPKTLKFFVFDTILSFKRTLNSQLKFRSLNSQLRQKNFFCL